MIYPLNSKLPRESRSSGKDATFKAHSQFVAAILIFLSSSALFSPAFAGIEGRFPSEEPNSVKSRIANSCLDRSGTIIKSDELSLTCETPLGRLDSVVAQMALGGSSVSAPKLLTRFVIIANGTETRVSANSWFETQSSFGQTITHPADQSKDQIIYIRNWLLSAGAERPSSIEADISTQYKARVRINEYIAAGECKTATDLAKRLESPEDVKRVKKECRQGRPSNAQ